MDKPNFSDLSIHSNFSHETWEAAWKVVNDKFQPRDIIDIWITVRDLNDKLNANPHESARALVNLSNL